MPVKEVNGKFLVLNARGQEVGYAFSRAKAEKIHAKKVGGAAKAASKPRKDTPRKTPTPQPRRQRAPVDWVVPPPPKRPHRVSPEEIHTLSRIAAPAQRRGGRDPGPSKGVLLAHKWKGQDVRRWWWSDKLDGVRAEWNGHSFWTRAGKPIAAPEWFVAQMPALPMDGELFLGPGRFQETVSVVRKADGRDPRWRQIRFHAFDAPTVYGGFEARDLALGQEARKSPVVVHVKQERVKPSDTVPKLLAAAERRGQEGIMLRKPESFYERKRSNTLLKVKSFHSAEARITGYTKGTGKHTGRLGAYTVEATGTGGVRRGVRFKIGTGISDAERDRPYPKGTVVTFTYQELTNSGTPRFPAMVGARDYE